MAGREAAQANTAQTLRVIAYNIYVAKGWPKERPAAQQAYKTGSMPRLLADELATSKPDIIVFSEAPPENTVKEIAGHLGMSHVWFPSGGSWPGALLSRYEIVGSENAPMQGERPKDLFTRHWGKGIVRLPSGHEVVVHSLHLMPGLDPAVRLREIPLIVASMKGDLDAGRSLLVMGDFNHVPDSKEYQLWMDAGLTDTFTAVGQGSGFTIKADNPERRIDYVMGAGPIVKKILAAKPLNEGAFRLASADPEAFALSDHLPQFAEFGLGE